MKKFILTNWREYAKSSLITFVAGFCIAFLPELNSIDIASIETSVVVGAILAGIRGGLKLLIEVFIAWYSSK